MKLYSELLKIVVNSHPTECHAAKELQKYLEIITGVTIPITAPAGSKENTIFIGETAPMTEKDESALKLDGFIIRTLPGNCLMLTGNKSVSSLYAVYDLLENYCGCGFFEDGEQIPTNKNLSIGEIDVLDNPRFEYRGKISNMTYNYSGMIWSSAEELITYVDRMAKKRINIWYPWRVLNISSMTAETLESMGYDIHPTDYQIERTEVLKEAFAYAELVGIRIIIPASDCFTGYEVDEQQMHEGVQLAEFIRQYNERHSEKMSSFHYFWGGVRRNILDITHPEAERFYLTYLRLCRTKLHASNCYYIQMPSEGGFSKEYTLEESGQLVINTYTREIELIHKVDEDAVIFSAPPFPYAKTYPYQIEAIKGKDIIFDENFLDRPARRPLYKVMNYYNGKKWMMGTLSHCANETNPCADVRYALSHAQYLTSDLRAEYLIGFTVQSEKDHRNIFANDLYYAMAWDPESITLDSFIEKYACRRYGCTKLLPSVKDIADTLYSARNTGMENCVLYRNFHNIYLPGLVSGSVKISLGYLPLLRRALENMLAHAKELENNDLFRLDVVDYGRTYLGFLFNLYLGGARLGGYYGNIQMVRKYAPRVLGLMDDIARLCSAHEEFRLQTMYDWAERFSPMEPEKPDANTRNVYLIFTNLLQVEHSEPTDYMAEDLAELIVHYYKPQVKAYLEDLDALVANGGKLSGRLTDDTLVNELPNRCNDFAPPKGVLKWSAFGATCEPELISREMEIRSKLVKGPSIRDSGLRYDGPITPLFAELLEKYPVTDELSELLSLDPTIKDNESADDKDQLLCIAVGEEIPGIAKGITVEQYDIEKDVRCLFDCTVLGKEYNIARGEIQRVRIRATDQIKFKRLEDAETADRSGTVKRYAFQQLGEEYIMEVDEGSESRPASIYVRK